MSHFVSSTAGTRGNGLLESFLAHKRMKQADRLIPNEHRSGRILDIGCGMPPLLLNTTVFKEKYGLDQIVSVETIREHAKRNITIVQQDVNTNTVLPYANDYFDIVTMLAVLEHVVTDRRSLLLKEIHRILRPGGLCIVTTPAHWTDPILWALTKTGFVSSEEIAEHENTFTLPQLRSVMQEGGFATRNMRCGTFECGINLYGRAVKA